MLSIHSISSDAQRECPTVMRTSTIGEGGDTTISSPGRSPKQPLPGIELHNPLHGREACPEFIAFNQGVGQICYIPALPESLNGSYSPAYLCIQLLLIACL